MGLLDKINPHATRQSATVWAIGSGIVGGFVGLLGWLATDMPTVAVFFVVPWMVGACALAGWALEWQVPSILDEDAEQGAAKDRSDE